MTIGDAFPPSAILVGTVMLWLRSVNLDAFEELYEPDEVLVPGRPHFWVIACWKALDADFADRLQLIETKKLHDPSTKQYRAALDASWRAFIILVSRMPELLGAIDSVCRLGTPEQTRHFIKQHIEQHERILAAGTPIVDAVRERQVTRDYRIRLQGQAAVHGPIVDEGGYVVPRQPKLPPYVHVPVPRVASTKKPPANPRPKKKPVILE